MCVETEFDRCLVYTVGGFGFSFSWRDLIKFVLINLVETLRLGPLKVH